MTEKNALKPGGPGDWIGIGTITTAHGIKGEVRVLPETDFPERFAEAEQLTVLVPATWGQPPAPTPEPGAGPRGRSAARGKPARPAASRAPLKPERFEVESVRPHQDAWLVKFEGIDDRTAAEKLRGLEVVVPRSEVKPLPEGTHYVFELEGLEVYTEEGEKLGVLSEVLFTGGNDVYVVKGPREILLPAIRDVIREVDTAAGRMTVRLLEGL